MGNESVRGERTANLVARQITRAIVSGELMPGTRLTEKGLAASYEVSRTPIREALVQLASVDLVQLVPNRGATVLNLTLADVAEMYQVRAILEAEAARLAARAITPEILGLLEKSCDRLVLLHDAPGVEQLAADTEFHYRIAEAAGSERLASLIRQVSAVPEAYRSTIAYTSGDMTEAERQHRGILAELAGRRPAGASRLMRNHIGWSCELAMVRLTERFGP